MKSPHTPSERQPKSRTYELTNKGRSVLSPDLQKEHNLTNHQMRDISWVEVKGQRISTNETIDSGPFVLFGASVTIISQHVFSVESIPITNDVYVLDINLSDAERDGNR